MKQPYNYRKKYHAITCFVLFLTFSSGAVASDPPPPQLNLSQLPIQFIENAGQWDATVEYGVIRGMEKAAFTHEGVTFFRPKRRSLELPAFTDNGFARAQNIDAWGQLDVLQQRFVRPSGQLQILGSELTETKTNFYIGSDSANWRAGLKSYAGLRYENVWDGIDVKYSEKNGKLVQRIEIDASTDASAVAFVMPGFAEGESLQNVRWYDGDGHVLPAGGEFRHHGDTVRLRPYRNFLERRMVIETEFNSLLGGSGNDGLCGFDVDEKGRLVLGMITTSTDLPTVNAVQRSHNGGNKNLTDYYVACFDPEMAKLQWSTYLGGTSDEQVEASANSTAGNIPQVPNKTRLETWGMFSYLLITTNSYDFPIAGSVVQAERPPPSMRNNSATAISRLNTSGQLDCSSWIGGPAWFGAIELEISAMGDVYVLGATGGKQWFVSAGALEDTIRASQVYSDSVLTSLALVKLSPSLDSVRAATYYLSLSPTFSGNPLQMKLTDQGDVIIAVAVHDTSFHPPMIKSWKPRGGQFDMFLCKINSDLQNYIFSTWMGVNSLVYPTDMAVTKSGGVVLSAQINTDTITVVNPISPVNFHSSILAKFPASGGLPHFVTYLPWPPTTGHGSQSASVQVLACDEILVYGLTSTKQFPFRNPIDTVRSIIEWTQTPYLLVLDPSGQEIRYGSYWHFDESYQRQRSIEFGSTHAVFSYNYGAVPTVVHNQQLYMAGFVPEIYKDSLTTFHAFQPLYGGGLQDVALIRTRAPGCALLACSVAMEDTVRISRVPAWISPERLLVEVEVANVDPVRKAGEVECVLTLPPGLVLDPATQSLRQSLSAAIAPGMTEHFTWTVRVDTTSLILAADSGVWIDVVTYYKEGDLPREGAPAASPCEYYIRFVSVDPVAPLFSCAMDTPDTLTVSAQGDAYEPSPFPVQVSLRNTTTESVNFARFGLHFGSDIGGSPIPANQKYLPGVLLPPGQTHAIAWQARAERRAEGRTVQLYATGEDSIGNVLTICEGEVYVPGLISPICSPAGPTELRVDPVTGDHSPQPILARCELRQVLDTILFDCAMEIDLSACSWLTLGGNDPRLKNARALASDKRDTLTWELTLRSIPTMSVFDTIVYRAYSGGLLRSTCVQVIPIIPLSEQLVCMITARDTLTEGQVLARETLMFSYLLRNTGTIATDIDRIVLTISAGNGVYADEALSQSGRTLAPSEQLTFAWTLHADIRRTARSVQLEVAAYGAADSLLSSCMHTLHIAGVEGLACDVSTIDTVRFLRSLPAYDPDPFTLTLELRNLLDSEETGIEARIDLTQAPRLVLAAGEVADKTLAVIDSRATGDLDWVLSAQPAPMEEDQRVLVRYRSDQQTEWQQCSTEVQIEAWQEETASSCMVGGHDSLFADPHYERYIPDPLHVSYTVTNTGTIALTGCEASIVLPPEFALAGSDSSQLFTAPAYGNQSGGPVPSGTLLPNASCTRWWIFAPTKQLVNPDPVQIGWVWSSDQQGTQSGCISTIHVIPDAPVGVLVAPLHLYFEAERGGSLPAGQQVQILTGGGLTMPWTMQPSQWWLSAQPAGGSQSASVAVQPTSSMLEMGAHGAEVLLAAAPTDRRIAVTYVIRKSTGTDGPPAATALSIEAWPQPVSACGVLHLQLGAVAETTVQLSLCDMLGRERSSLDTHASETFTLDLAPMQLTPGIYLLRLRTSMGETTSRMISVVR